MKRMVMLLLCVFLCMSGAQAAELFAEQQTEGQQQIQSGLNGEAQSVLSGTSTQQELLQNITQMLHNTQRERDNILRQTLKTMTRISVILILCSIVSGLSNTAKLPPLLLSMVGALGIAAAVYQDLNGLMSVCTQTAEQLRVLSKCILPVMLTAVTLTGAPTAASVSYTATMFALDLCISVMTDVLIPAVSAYIAMITVNAALANHMLTRLAAFLRWLTVSALKLMLTIFFSYLTISGTVSHGLDAAAVKTAKFALNGSVPVVGSILSGATESVLSGAAVLKNSLGLFGMLCVAAVCVIPFLRAGISYLVFKTGTAVLSPICSPALASLLDGISDSIGIILGMLGSCCAILFFELVYSVVMIT